VEKGSQLRASPLLTIHSSSLVWREWEQALVSHPGGEFVEYIVKEIREGFLDRL